MTDAETLRNIRERIEQAYSHAELYSNVIAFCQEQINAVMAKETVDHDKLLMIQSGMDEFIQRRQKWLDIIDQCCAALSAVIEP